MKSFTVYLCKKVTNFVYEKLSSIFMEKSCKLFCMKSFPVYMCKKITNFVNEKLSSIFCKKSYKFCV